ncbi:ATP-dependent nuclease [Pontibacter litorisediminis]|uniref:ATP-dependent nuclease n=1 Tax=Pontibacter litorisediminis TaxID=1846260 RepID=UPI0023ECAE4D|nr:ATP-binding protein [Pontibacter litorisediminis]
MNLKKFGIKNYRSFDADGVTLTSLKKVNVIIGKNNCGKSNFLRFIKTLNENLSTLNKFPDDINNQHRRNGKSASIVIEKVGKDLIYQEKRYQNYDRGNLKDFVEGNHKLVYNIKDGAITNIQETFSGLTPSELIAFQNKYSSADAPTLINTIQGTLAYKITTDIKNEFKSVIYIPHLRIIKEGHKFGDSNSSIDGSNIISKMFEMQNPRVGEESNRNKFFKIQQFVRELLNDEELVIEIPYTKDDIIISLHDNRLPLDHYGTGIHQLVLLCSTLVIHENSVVCIEEPEIHLHPELQRKFLSFLLTTDNTYFITTHSNIFLEHNDDVSIYHVSYDGIKSSVNHCNTTAQSYELLANLGYKASDLLHSNGIIWVEGPSDRTLINKWISLVDDTLIEGIHYSIMYYGGRLLSALTFSSDHNAEELAKELIPLLRINKNAYVVIDRDGFNSKASLNRTKTRICEEIGQGKFWVTKGREIENYLHDDTVNSWLQTSTFNNDIDLQFGESLRKVNSNIKYERDKNGYIRKLEGYVNENSLDVLDLRKQIKALVRAIQIWNT